MRVELLVWNLKHGRSVPGAGRELICEFSDALADWSWDVALLQEVPPWWGPAFGRRLDVASRLVLTSRNELPTLRRALAQRWPDLIKSAGGGANAILVHRRFALLRHCQHLLRRFPERRWLHAVQLECAGNAVRGVRTAWVANLHAGGSIEESLDARSAILKWAGSEPVILGGDFNIHDLTLAGFEPAGGRFGDHIFLRGLSIDAPLEVLDAGPLSDHAPLRLVVGR